MVKGGIVLFMFLVLLAHGTSATNHDYRDALSKSILYFEGQRSGKLPPNQRLTWRKDSALKDGSTENVDLVGGYYDAGDHVKFGFPMAFTATVLSWSALEFGKFMGPELANAKAAIRWATDYFLKATAHGDKIFVQVGEPTKDHDCWERAEDMDTPRTVYSIDSQHPGSDVSAEIAAAFAAASIVFKKSDASYSRRLLQTAKRLFDFADKYRGAYSDNADVRSGICPFYCSYSGYDDELLWGAAWLYKASHRQRYLDYIQTNSDALGAQNNLNQFGWDDKHAGTNVLLSKVYLLHNVSFLQSYKNRSDSFLCWLLPEVSPHVQYTPGGLMYEPGIVNMQHVTADAFLLLTYAKYLDEASQLLSCENSGGPTDTVLVTPQRLRAVAKGQIDYILGHNPLNMSYMVGYGSKFPRRIHHRGSSLPSTVDHPSVIPCGSWEYLYTGNDNPNLLTGAVVGGPDGQDEYTDYRLSAPESEPTTYINAPLVGALAYFRATSQ